MKITSLLNSAVLGTIQGAYKVQATQDATKFNECLSAESFALMHHVFFSPKVREYLGFPVTDATNLMHQI